MSTTKDSRLLNSATSQSPRTGLTCENPAGPRRASSIVALAVCAVLLAGVSARAANTETWTGASSQNWGTAGNWAGTDKPPASGDSIVFTSGSGSGTLIDNLTSGASFQIGGITFGTGAASFIIDPNAPATNFFTLIGSISDTSANAETINDNIVLGATEPIATGPCGNLTLGGVISGSAAADGISVLGSGITILTASNTYTGVTTVESGTLELNFAQTPYGGTPVVSNIVSNLSALTMGSTDLEGGVLLINGSSGVTLSQTFNNTTFKGATQIDVVSNGATSINVSLGTLTRSAGSTVDFVIPTSGTINVAVATPSFNQILVTSATTAYASANNGTTWATNTSGIIGALSTYSTGNSNYTSGNNVDVGTSDAPGAPFTVNTLRFNSSNSTLTASGSSIIATGGILVTPTATAAVLTGGTIGSGAGKEIVIIDNGAINISSVIANSTGGASALTISGTGTTTISGNDTYTGVTVINGGTVSVTGSMGSVASTITINTGADLVGSAAGAFSNTTVVPIGGEFTETVANALSGSAALTVGTTGIGGTAILSQANNFTGAVSLSNATNVLTLSNTNAIASAASVSATGGVINLLSNSSVTFNTPNFNTSGGNGVTFNVDDLDGLTTGQTITISGSLTPRSNGSVVFTAGHNYTLDLSGVALNNTTGQTSTLIVDSGHLIVGGITNVTATGSAAIVLSGSTTGNAVTGAITNGSGTMGVTVSGTNNTWTLSGNNTYTGKTTVISGTLIAANVNALGASGAPLSMSGGTLDIATDSSITAYNTTVTANSTILSDRATTSAAGITQTLGTLSIGADTLNIGAGPNVSGGSPVVAFGATTLNTTASTTTVFDPTTASLVLASVTGAASSGNTNTLDMDGTSTGNQITGAISNSTNGTTALIKTNTSTWTLSGANTYSGTTTIFNGDLVVTNSNTGGGAVTLNGSYNSTVTTPILSGTGNITGAVTTTGTGVTTGASHIAPGMGAGNAGTLTLAGGLTLGAGTNLDYTLGSTSSVIDVTGGTLTLGSNLNMVLNITAGSGFAFGTYDLINYTGATLSGTAGSNWTLSASSIAGLPGTNISGSVSVNTSLDEVILTISGSTSTVNTTYTLASSATNANVLVGGTLSIASSIANTGASDNLGYSGLGSTSSGSIAGATTSGTISPTASGTNSGQTFTASSSGTYVLTPSVSSATDIATGSSATATGTTPLIITAYNPASFTAVQSGTNYAVSNAAGTYVASGSVTSNSLTGQSGFTGDSIAGTVVNAGGTSATLATFNPNGLLNGTYSATSTIDFNDVTSSGSAIVGGAGGTQNVGLTATVSGYTATSGSAGILAGGGYGGYSLTNSAGKNTFATLLGGTAGGATTVNFSFTNPNGRPTGGYVSSDVLTLTGIHAIGGTGSAGQTFTDTYVLEMSVAGTSSTYLGWYDPALSQWVNAIAGNSTANLPNDYYGPGTADQSGTYFDSAYAGQSALGDYGSYIASGTEYAWAVVDYDADFTLIPEPGTWGMILGGFGMLIGIQKLRRRRVGT